MFLPKNSIIDTWQSVKYASAENLLTWFWSHPRPIVSRKYPNCFALAVYFLLGWDQIFLEFKFVHSLTAFYKRVAYWLWFCLSLRIHWRLSTVLKQKARSNVSSYAKVCIFWKWIQCTIHWDKTQMLKKISFAQNKR